MTETGQVRDDRWRDVRRGQQLLLLEGLLLASPCIELTRSGIGRGDLLDIRHIADVDSVQWHGLEGSRLQDVSSRGW
jgi:hypothetical protein